MSNEERILHVTEKALDALSDGPDDGAAGTEMARIGIAGRQEGNFNMTSSRLTPKT